MRLLTWLASFAAELLARRRFRCAHEFTDLAMPPACIRCGITARPSPDWGC